MKTSKYGRLNNTTTEKLLVFLVLAAALAELHIFSSACHTTSNGNPLGMQLQMRKVMAMKAHQQQTTKNEAALGLQHEVRININTLY